MSTLDIFHGQAAGASHPFRLPRFETARRMYRAMRERSEHRRAVRELRAMNRHVLKDIGIDRSEIVSVIHGQPGERTRSYAGF